MEATRTRSCRTTPRGVAVSAARSCRLQASGSQLTPTTAIPVPFRPDRPARGRASLLVKFTFTPSGVPASVVYVQGDRSPGGGVAPNAATAVSYPLVQLTANTIQARRISRVLLPLTGDVQVYVARGSVIASASSLEVE